MADPITTMNVTTGAVFIPEVWSDEVISAAEANLVFATLVNRNYEGEIKQKGDVVHIPNVSNLTAHDKEKGIEVTVQAPTETETTLTINKHKEVSFYIEDILKYQASKDLRAEYTAKAGYAIAKALDSDLAALYAGLSQTQGNGSSAITEDLILDALQNLDDAEVPETERVLVIKPSQKKAIRKIDKFVKAEYVGQNPSNMPVVTGLIGDIYGAKVYCTTQIVVADSKAHNMLFHKGAFALAVQLDPRVQASYEQKMLAWLITVDVLYGVKELRDTYAVDIITTQ